jgi:hypothetical protein
MSGYEGMVESASWVLYTSLTVLSRTQHQGGEKGRGTTPPPRSVHLLHHSRSRRHQWRPPSSERTLSPSPRWRLGCFPQSCKCLLYDAGRWPWPWPRQHWSTTVPHGRRVDARVREPSKGSQGCIRRVSRSAGQSSQVELEGQGLSHLWQSFPRRWVGLCMNMHPCRTLLILSSRPSPACCPAALPQGSPLRPRMHHPLAQAQPYLPPWPKRAGQEESPYTSSGWGRWRVRWHVCMISVTLFANSPRASWNIPLALLKKSTYDNRNIPMRLWTHIESSTPHILLWGFCFGFDAVPRLIDSASRTLRLVLSPGADLHSYVFYTSQANDQYTTSKHINLRHKYLQRWTSHD